MSWELILKRQTTLQGFDPKNVERLVEPDKSNIWIAPIEDPNIPNEEKSRLSDKMLDELARLNVGNKFTITSATGRSGQWGTEPSFMLTGVPTSLESKIYEMADKYNQDAIAVSAKGEKGAKFITPKGKVTDKFEDMEFDPYAEYSTDFPSGQRLTFKSLDKWGDVLKLFPPEYYEPHPMLERRTTFRSEVANKRGWGKNIGMRDKVGNVNVSPHYLFNATKRGKTKNTDEMETWVDAIKDSDKWGRSGNFWAWRFKDKSNLDTIMFKLAGKGTITFQSFQSFGTNTKGLSPTNFVNIWKDKRKNPHHRGQIYGRSKEDFNPFPTKRRVK